MEERIMIENGTRLDGRRFDEVRPIKIEVGVLRNAVGSAYVEWGKNKVIAAAFGPREVHPRHQQSPIKAIVRCNYNMAAFSVPDRKRPGPDRRSSEISKVISDALTGQVFVERFPRTAVDVFVEVLEASAGTRCVALTASSLALADAGIPMRGLLVGCAAGKINGEVVLDLGKEEDNYGEADLPVGIEPMTGEISLMQMDGHFTREEFDKALGLITEASKGIHEMMIEALKRRYSEV